ncbi:CMTR2.2 family protein [Megaselia abdita]
METIRVFQKKVSYNDYNNRSVLNPSSQFFRPYDIQEFTKFKNDYYSEQDSLFRNVNEKSWRKLTSMYNPSSHILSMENKRDFEMFTRPWLKIYEILEEFNVFSNYKGRLNTLHLGEKIGSMVCAVNHYLYSKRLKITWEWIATNLNLYYEDNVSEKLLDCYAGNDIPN